MHRAAARLLLLVAAVAAAGAAPSCVPPAGLLDVDTTGCCLDQPPAIDTGSSPAFISGVLAHFAYPTSVRGLLVAAPRRLMDHCASPPAACLHRLHTSCPTPPTPALHTISEPVTHMSVYLLTYLHASASLLHPLPQFSTLSADCVNDCAAFQAPFTELAKSFGAEQVAFVNGADDHLSEPLCCSACGGGMALHASNGPPPASEHWRAQWLLYS